MRGLWEKSLAHAMDTVMCAMMNRLQWRLRHRACTRETFDAYLDACEPLTPEEFFDPGDTRIPPPTAIDPLVILEWPSPVRSGFAENDTARALWYVGPNGPSAPTAMVFHALLSASDIGYRRLATWFHRHGWNMVFPHLPFHYSRTPRGYRNGALAVTADLPLVAETLRQAVAESRQILTFLREQGCEEFGLLGTSYGGWVSSLLSFVEPAFQFITLIQPIIDVEHVTWESPAAAAIRRIVSANGITPGAAHRHSHLTSPLHGRPLTPTDRITLIGGKYDTVAPSAGLRELANAWSGATFVEVRQGHFGYAALAEAKRRIEPVLAQRRPPTIVKE